MDPAAISTGDLVRVELEPEVFQAMQEGHGGWSEIMLEVHTCTVHVYMCVYCSRRRVSICMHISKLLRLGVHVCTCIFF